MLELGRHDGQRRAARDLAQVDAGDAFRRSSSGVELIDVEYYGAVVFHL